MTLKCEDLHSLIRGLTDADETRRTTARFALLREDEAIVGQLIDEFYAGVNLETGKTLLGVIGQIGGYEAAALFRDVIYNNTSPVEWREIALYWLEHDNLI